MSSHSIAEAKERFPAPLDRALQREPAAITRECALGLGSRAFEHWKAGRITDEPIDWLERTLVRQAHTPVTDAATRVNRTRDGD